MKKKPLTNKKGDVRELTTSDLRSMKRAHEILPEEFLNAIKRKRGERGLQKEPKKVLISVRYSPEVVKYFKSTGEGWQTRMDKALKNYIKNKQHPHRAT